MHEVAYDGRTSALRRFIRCLISQSTSIMFNGLRTRVGNMTAARSCVLHQFWATVISYHTQTYNQTPTCKSISLCSGWYATGAARSLRSFSPNPTLCQLKKIRPQILSILSFRDIWPLSTLHPRRDTSLRSHMVTL
jgi:hypothetical protein